MSYNHCDPLGYSHGVSVGYLLVAVGDAHGVTLGSVDFLQPDLAPLV